MKQNLIAERFEIDGIQDVHFIEKSNKFLIKNFSDVDIEVALENPDETTNKITIQGGCYQVLVLNEVNENDGKDLDDVGTNTLWIASHSGQADVEIQLLKHWG